MVKKETNNREQQNEFIALLQQCISKFDEADMLYDKVNDFINNRMPSETSIYDSEQQDFLHIFEDYDLTDSQLINIGKAMVKNRDNRRNWHNIYEIAKVWNEHKGKVFNSNSRVFLKDNIKKVIEKLDKQWNYRQLSEQDIEKLLKIDEPIIKNKRGKRPSITEEIINKVLKDKSNKVPVKVTAEKLQLGLSTVYKIREGFYSGV